MPSISTLEFFETLFQGLDPKKETIFCTTFDHHPSDGDPWSYNSSPKAIARRKRPRSEYYCTTSVANQEHPRRGAEFLMRQYVLVLDDIGSKVEENPLKPTYKVQTSDGSYHWGYRFTVPLLVSEGMAQRLVSAVYTGRGLTDEGGKMVNKMVRPPAGVNFKYDPENPTDVVMSEWNPEVSYTPEEMVEAWDLVLGEAAPAAEKSTTPALKIHDTFVVEDDALEWMREQGLVTRDNGSDDWTNIICPWHHNHSEEHGQDASYSPFGRGNMKDARGYRCHHGSCETAGRNTRDLMEWIAAQGGPELQVRDSIELMVKTHVYLKNSGEIVDVTAPASAPYDTYPLSNWQKAYQQVAYEDASGTKHTVFSLFQERMRSFDGATYAPGQPKFIGDKYLNNYRPPLHPRSAGEPEWFLDHIDHVIPDPEQCDMVLDWLAYKVQNPGARSYAVIMVADFGADVDGERYGIGRSMIGDALRAVLQAGVVSVSLEDIVGGGSQGAYTEWQANTQLVIVEETKEEVGEWKKDVNHYEKLKGFIDPKVIRGVRIKPKFGKIFYSDLYFNMMLFTNHADALALPRDDRRILAVGNNTQRRTKAEYRQVIDALENPDAIAQLYWWLMERVVDEEVMIYPPMTPEKQRMIETSATTLDEAWLETIDRLHGDLVTQKQLMATMESIVVTEFEDEKMGAYSKTYARKKYRALDYLSPGNRNVKVYDSKAKRQIPCKILRNVGQWQATWLKHDPDDISVFLDELEKNSPRALLRKAQ